LKNLYFKNINDFLYFIFIKSIFCEEKKSKKEYFVADPRRLPPPPRPALTPS
jgi:hypothetical protein